MPRFSCFGAFGELAFSSEVSAASTIYDQMVGGKRDAFDMSVGTYEEVKTFAQAKGVADAGGMLYLARNQMNPYKCIDLLPQLEKDWGVVPPAGADLFQRQSAVAAKMVLSRGAKREAIETALRALLGSGFVALRVISYSESTWHAPATANFARVDLPWKLVKLTEPVAKTGSPLSVAYANADAAAAQVVVVPGDALTVQPSKTSLSEVVVVASTIPGEFTATFANPHDAGSYATTQNWPNWTSSTRTLLIVVTSAVSSDAAVCKHIDDLMEGVSRAVSDWAIVTPTTPGASTIGPFTLDASPLGSVTVGQIAIFT